MATKIKSIAELFFEDELKAIVERALDGPSASFIPTDLPYIVGSLSFLARLDEASTYFRHYQSQLTISERIVCRFYLAVAYCRHNRAAESRAWLIANARDRRHTDDPLARFYIAQGIGFYRYTYGESKKALKWGVQAFEVALLAGFQQGRILAQDLKAQILIQMGSIRPGLKQLGDLREFASLQGLKNTVEWSHISLTLHEAHFGLMGPRAIAGLHQLLQSPSELDSYSRALVIIELARQQMLAGLWDEAGLTLEATHALVYQVSNPRLEIRLNLCQASWLEGRDEREKALALIEFARKSLAKFDDHNLERRVLGQLMKLRAALGLDTREEAAALSRLHGRLFSYIGRRIENRSEGSESIDYPVGQDPYGDLLDLIVSRPRAAIDMILRSGWLHLLYGACEVNLSESMVILDLDGFGSLTTFDLGNVEHRPRVVTPLLRKLLVCLAKGERSKEDILFEVWGHKNFHPHQHNNLIHNLLGVLRKILGKKSEWLVMGNIGYGLHSEVRLRQTSVFSDENPVAIPRTPPEKLNSRQLLAIARLKTSGSFDAKAYGAWFKVSEATALRDLRHLLEKGVIEKFGRARSTNYRVRNNV